MVRFFSRFPGYRRSNSKPVNIKVCSLKKDEDVETSCGSLSGHDHVLEFDLEFKSVAHPVEPSNDDGPVRCPMPDSSFFTPDSPFFTSEGTLENHTIKSLNKKDETLATKKRMVVAAPRPPKHAPLTLSRSRSVPLFGSTNIAISLMLQNRIFY